ncbi:MAG: glycosyltransferase family 9 protein [Candidatus Omnitrophica bacterium]|nr:glycosyltransferase family 9 protein [Candidatus Omnitrophota bacterium]
MKKILVIRVGNMGDVLMATPFLRALHKVFPLSEVDFVTSPQAYGIVANNPYVKNIFIYKKYKDFWGGIRREMLCRRLKARGYDLCFVLEEHPQYKDFGSRSVSSKALKVGFSGQKEECLTYKLDFSHDKHVIENYLNMLQEFFQAEFTEDDLSMDLIVRNTTAADQLKQEVKSLGKYVLIHPGTTEYLPYRSWTPEGYAQIIDDFQEKGIAVLLTGQAMHQPLIDQILKQCKIQGRVANIHCLLDKDFDDLIYYIQNASVVLCSDTGVLHVARALNVPVLGLFGPSNPQHTGAIGKGVYGFIRNDFPCGPCNYSPQYRYEEKKSCLDGNPPPCMRSITADRVKILLRKLN